MPKRAMSEHSRKDHDRLAARLLSRKNQLSRPEKEAIFDGVMQRLPDGDRPWTFGSARNKWLLLSGLGGAALATAMMFLFVLPRVGDSPEFAKKGAAPSGPTLRLACAEAGRAGPCAQGRTILFEASGYGSRRHFAAFARRDDGTVIWYFPDAAAALTLTLSDDGSGRALKKGIAIGAEHTAGRYVVYGLFFEQPRTRPEIRTLMAKDVAGDFTLIEQELVIE